MTFLAGATPGCETAEPGDVSSPPWSRPKPQDHPPVRPGSGFVSDAPGGAGASSGPLATMSDFGAESVDDGRSAEAASAIAEADVVQVVGDRLYALSRYAGLSIVDARSPDDLRLLGRWRTMGVPFEMYVRGDVVLAMVGEHGRQVMDATTRQPAWVESSRLEAIDVSNPAAPASIGSFDLPGALADSRIVGDTLYVVTFEDGACWGCASTPTTTVTSLSVKDPAGIGVVDQLEFAEPSGAYAYGWRRSVTVTPERMYVAGIEWDGQGPGHSTIQVVDISDPGGDMTLGASVEVAGQIESRWQMDEHEGVLRVVSQPGLWSTEATPRVQTFAITSSAQLMPLGAIDLVLPRPERLRSVRFDGPRGYAITSEQTDPLFTIDLSAPGLPRQAGELEMPGWIHHMEPRGDRLLALGFDPGHPEGSLHATLFDVSNLESPVLLQRVAFGGEWAQLPEDQDRIHKAFALLDDLGLVLVPFTGWSGIEAYCGAAQIDAIQLIDWSADTLVRRGTADTRGSARRGLVHGGRLLAMSDEAILTHDIANRDRPRRTGALALSASATQAIAVGDHVVRLAGQSWSPRPELEIVSRAAPDAAEPLAVVDLAPLVQSRAEGHAACASLAGARLFTHGTSVYVAWSPDGTSTRVAVVDLGAPASPRLAGHVDVRASLYGGYGWSWTVLAAGDPVVQVGSTLVFLSEETREEWSEVPAMVDAALVIVDLADPDRPRVAATQPLPRAAGHTPLQVAGTQVLSSHWVPEPGAAGKVRFWLDRVDVAAPSAPQALPLVNVPGSLAAFDAPSSRVLTVDYERETVERLTPEQCWERHGQERYAGPDMVGADGAVPAGCEITHRVFELVDLHEDEATLRDELPLADDLFLSELRIGDDRVFGIEGSYWIYADAMTADAAIGRGFPAGAQRAIALGGMRAGELRSGWTELEPLGGAQALAVDGQRLLLAGWTPPALHVLDAPDVEAPVLRTAAELPGAPESATVRGGVALVAMGPYGVAAVPLAPRR